MVDIQLIRPPIRVCIKCTFADLHLCVTCARWQQWLVPEGICITTVQPVPFEPHQLGHAALEFFLFTMGFEKFHHLGETTTSAQANSVDTAADSNIRSLDPQVVRKLRLKMDLVLLPTLTVMYTFK